MGMCYKPYRCPRNAYTFAKSVTPCTVTKTDHYVLEAIQRGCEMSLPVAKKEAGIQ